VAAKSTSDDSICLAEAVYRFVPVVVNGRSSNYNCGVPLVKFPIRKGKIFFDAIAIEFVPNPVIIGRQLRLLRTGWTFSGMKGAGYKGRISLIAFQF
jgi:hypothetical protein